MKRVYILYGHPYLLHPILETVQFLATISSMIKAKMFG